jgi:anti-anti-sigma regulatory factor
VLDRPLGPDGVARLCAAVAALLLDGGVTVVVCDVRALGHPDLVVVDTLARLQLTARRAGGRIRVRGASDDLRHLLVLAGLADVVGQEGATG